MLADAVEVSRIIWRALITCSFLTLLGPCDTLHGPWNLFKKAWKLPSLTDVGGVKILKKWVLNK
jgi:hypothetical protein